MPSATLMLPFVSVTFSAFLRSWKPCDSVPFEPTAWLIVYVNPPKSTVMFLLITRPAPSAVRITSTFSPACAAATASGSVS